MTFVSHAQNFEDVMLWRALKHVEKGFFIDVGANSPVAESVTKAFYDCGWHGINVEPVSEWFEKLENNRQRDINLNLAAGASEGTLKFYEVVGTGLSTSVKKHADDARAQGNIVKEIEVPIARLTTICEQYAQPIIHFLKIDVEGAEKTVLTGMDFSRFRPWVLLIEANYPNSTEENIQEWEGIVLASNYELAYRDGLNYFYVSKEHCELLDVFRYPPNVFDDFIRSEQHEAELKSQFALARATAAEAGQLEAELIAQQAEKSRLDVINSHTWRMTAPLRFLGDRIKWILRGGVAWVTFKPSSRPRRVLKQAILHLRNWLFLRPQVKARILPLLNRFPQLKSRFRRLHYANPLSANSGCVSDLPGQLTPRAHQILDDLERAIAIHRQRRV